MKAIWNDTTIAESDETIVIEGNHYFPPSSVHDEYLEASDHRTRCPWKGQAHYYNVVVNDERNTNAAWYYPNPKEEAEEIKDHVAFWNGIKVVE